MYELKHPDYIRDINYGPLLGAFTTNEV